MKVVKALADRSAVVDSSAPSAASARCHLGAIKCPTSAIGVHRFERYRARRIDAIDGRHLPHFILGL
jgi:hypothetical protein